MGQGSTGGAGKPVTPGCCLNLFFVLSVKRRGGRRTVREAMELEIAFLLRRNVEESTNEA